MKFLVFEYSCVCLKSSLFSEGFNMLKSILDDLDCFSFFEVDYLINDTVSHPKYQRCNAVYVGDDLFSWLNENAGDYDYCIFIAPEDERIQYFITRILEENDVNIIGCDSCSSYICSSKSLTYDKLPRDILKIKTIKTNIDEISYEIICDILNLRHFIIKPDDNTSSHLVYHIHNQEELITAIREYEKTSMKYVLIQEYIDGEALSVSAVCNENNIKCISINSQEIVVANNRIKYLGCESPIEHPLKSEMFSISKRIIESIEGIKGFVGLDYMIKEDKIYFVELNSRITTPYIVLQRKCLENFTQSIIKFVLYNTPLRLSFESKGRFEVSDKL